MAQTDSLPQHSFRMPQDVSKTIKTVVDIIGNPDISEQDQMEYLKAIRGIRESRPRWKGQPKERIGLKMAIYDIYIIVGDMWYHFGINRKGEIAWVHPFTKADDTEMIEFVSRRRAAA